jgi:uncharacterized repeat protein (TIGR01451 family)
MSSFLRPARVSTLLLFVLCAVLFASPASAVSDIVISQVYGGGGNSGATLTNDFIELFNRGNSAISLSGWSVQYASATGTTWQRTNLTNVTLQPGQYYLIQEAQGAGGTTALPTPDAIGTIPMAGTAGKVALVTNQVLLTGACPGSAAGVIDFVGFGTTANCFEGAGPTPAPSNTTAVLRAGNGCTDTDSNPADFASGAPNPRNTATTLAPCGPVLPTLSVNDVALAEGNAGTTTFTFTVSLSAPAGPGGVTFDIATADNTATTGDNDYVANSLTGQTIPAGSSTYSFNVLANGDTTVEPTETFFVNVTNVTGATVADGQGVGTISNDDSPPAISIDDVAVTEGNSGTTNLTFTVSLSSVAAAPVTVNWATSDGTAVNPSDYTAANGTVTFAPSDLSESIVISINGDLVFEPNETFTVELTTPSANATISDPSGTGTITNDDLQPISITAVQTLFSENFDSLANTGTSSVTPVGWTFAETGTNANTLYTAGTGSSTSGDTYSFGATSATDRAFGGLLSSSNFTTIGALYQNDTGTTITNARIAYTGEQWRLGANTGRTDTFEFYISTNATSPTNGTWTRVSGLDLLSPVTSGTVGALNGNDAANQAARNYTITGLSIPAGAQFWIRFVDANASGSDDGLGVDNFSIEVNVAASTLSIPQIQGSGTATPFAGQAVTTTGIVTALKANGFFMQNPTPDADPNTSEGIFVFIGAAPAVSIGDSVTVTGTATEFFGLTQLASGLTGVTVDSSGNSVPAPIALSTVLIPTGTPESNLERYEGMLLSGALTTLAPTEGFFETWTWLTGTPRPMREEGLEASKPLPPGAPCCIPRFDENPERLMIDADGIAGNVGAEFPALIDLGTITGPLDYSFGNYKLLPLAQLGSPDRTFIAARMGTADELTVASFNIENFGTGLGPSTYTLKIDKGSLVVRNVLNYPDIIGMVEVEDQTALDALVAKINTDAALEGQFPNYVGYLVESNLNSSDNDQDVGFIVKSSRVTVISVEQGLLPGGVRATFTDPVDSSTDILNDREPLILRATIQRSPADPVLPVTVIVNHLRSLIDIDNEPVEGPRVREKRRRQAEYLANLVQSLRATEPNIVLVGDFNAFQFNDGYVDLLGTIKGDPTPDAEVTLASPDLVDPNLIDLVTLEPVNEQYSFIFNGNPQVLDHVVVTPELFTLLVDFVTARNNADFPETALFATNPTRPERISDHDLPVAYFALPMQANDPPVNTVPGPQDIAMSSYLYFSSGRGNAISIADPDAGTAPVEVTLSVTAGTLTLTSSGLTFSAGDGYDDPSMTFTGSQADINAALQTLLFAPPSTLGTVTLTMTTNDLGNTGTGGPLSDTDTVEIVVSPRPAFSINDVVVTEGDAGTTLATFTVSIDKPVQGNLAVTGYYTRDVSATAGSDYLVSLGDVVFNPGDPLSKTITVTILGDLLPEPDETFEVVLGGVLGADVADGVGLGTITNDDAGVDLAITKVATPDPVLPGTNLTYTITVSNGGPVTATAVTMSDVVPAGTRFLSLSAAAGWSCATPSVGGTGAVTCTVAELVPGSVSFTLVVSVDASLGNGTTISNTAAVTASTVDPILGNNSGTATTIVGSGSADLSVVKTVAPEPVPAGANLTYTITVTNAGPSAATTATLTDILPAGTTFVSLTAPAEWVCTTPVVGAAGTVSCTAASLPVGSSVVTLVVAVDSTIAPGTSISNSATVSSATTDPTPGNESSTAASLVTTSIPTLSEWMLLALAAMLGLTAAIRLRV